MAEKSRRIGVGGLENRIGHLRTLNCSHDRGLIYISEIQGVEGRGGRMVKEMVLL